MKLGIFNMGTGISDPGSLRTIAEAAEASGLESLWCGEHVVLPKPRVAPSPADPKHHFLHPSVVLGYLAACTKTLRLGTGIVLIAQRNPLVLAKEFASVDVVSGGRAILGIGAGYLQPEFDAIGAPFRERGRRTDEAIDAMRALWNEEDPTFDGQFWQFSGIDAHPRPTSPGGVPIHIGGHSEAALKRAAERGQGWYGWMQDPEQTADYVRRLHELSEQVGRPEAMGELEITITPPARLTSEAIEQYEEAGAHRLVSLATPTERSMLHGVEHLGSLAG
ncbi:MAG: LLM class F420-dependent oxidoreductase [Chloroflexi bacterium]|nr:LLM class F420-dependent oxidoreductase [Chloroflexota bacterium]MCY3589112.1 LLM class F420-dependent oxidoreductase [Chloroflexota bacterium]MCY3686108.1 LLM class F420-dependent oxidoreductase [Chloroflexota bacterium]MDE2710037.1 LLM class F420-dependent oxidoreductase [Chloroflexota bacterium]